MTASRWTLLSAAAFSLFVGGAIYLLLRSPQLIYYGWLEGLAIDTQLTLLRSMINPSTSSPSWVIYSLPDGLWLFSYVCVILAICRDSPVKQFLHWLILMPSLAFSLEVLQLTRTINGTFDVTDIGAYIFALLIPILIFTKKNSSDNEND